MRSLQWLPVRRRIFFKTAVLVRKCIHDVAPAYLQEVCLPVESVPGPPRLRSASTGCVELPKVLTSNGQRSFSFHGPTGRVCNSLPSALRDDSLSLNTFSRQLKAYLFGQYCTPSGAVAAFYDSGAVYICHDLLTYLL